MLGAILESAFYRALLVIFLIGCAVGTGILYGVAKLIGVV